MTIHGSVLRAPGICTVAGLMELLTDMPPTCPVMVAIGEDEDGPKVGHVKSVVELRDPIQQDYVCLIVPEGALGPAYDAMLAAAPEPEEQEPS